MKHDAQDDGFSLVEVMVVIFIIGLMSTVAAMTLPFAPDAADDARAFHKDLVWAQETSQMTGRVYAVEIKANGYRFLERDQGTWVPSQRQFVQWSQDVQLVRNGSPMDLVSQGEAVQPIIVLLPGGEVTNFQLIFAQAGGAAEVSSDGANLILGTGDA